MTTEEFKTGAIDALLRIADRFGVPCVILAVVLFFGREMAITIHGTVVEPVVKGHVEFLETTSETLKEICQIQSQQARTLQELSHGQNELRVVVKEISEGGKTEQN